MRPSDEQLMQMWSWYQQRQVQQLSYPVDDATRAALRAVVGAGAGSHALTQNKAISVPSTPFNGSIAVPAAYSGTLLVSVEGTTYEIPYL